MAGTRKALIAGVLAASAGACVPLEQAPLVYSSRQQLGVGVVAGTPENPGLDINIGYKGLDAAFVPVISGKPCPPPPSTVCTAEHYALRTTLGRNDQSAEQQRDEQVVHEIRDRIDRLETRIRTRSVLIEQRQRGLALLSTEGALTLEKTALTSVDPATNLARTLSAAENGRLAQVEAELKQIAALKTEDVAGGIARLNRQNVEDVEAKAKAEARLRELVAAQGVNTGDKKEDALSVYGSFNGDVNAKADGATLSLGKVFSTGVAAQFLTQGIREAALADSTSRCIENAAKAVGSSGIADAGKTALLERLLAKCGR